MLDDEQTDVGSPAEQASSQPVDEEAGQQGTVVVVKRGPLGSAGAAIAKAGEAAGQAAQNAAGAVSGAVKGAAHGVADTAGSAAGAIRGRLGHGSADDEVAAAIAEEVADITVEQNEDTAEYAKSFLRKILRLGVVRVDREQFLESGLRDQGVDEERIRAAIATRPAEAGIPHVVLSHMAKEAMQTETNIAAATSFAAGLPGGFALAATIPGDISQYYVHVFRLIQKLAYIYGWQSFLDDCDDVSDETLYEFLAFFGVAMGVQNATSVLTKLAVETAQASVAKHVAAQALTKTAWYAPLKKALNFIGIKITKDIAGRAVGKVVPVVGGAVCGGMTYVSLKKAGKRLADHLVTLPQADPNMETCARETIIEAPPVDDTDDAGFDVEFVEGDEPAEESDV